MTDVMREMVSFDGEDGKVPAYLARPRGEQPRPAVMVIHEIWGLSDHIKAVADRFAEQGYVAFAPHLYSRPGLAEVLTPANIGAAMQFRSTLQMDRAADPAYVQQEIAKLPPEKRSTVQSVFPLMSSLPKDKFTQDLIKGKEYLDSQSFVETGKIASLGFCFGGGMSIYFACHARLAACVVFYGENPNPIELVDDIAGPVLGLYGAEDLRINRNLDSLVKAMATYKKDFEMKIYPGAGHAFFNDTNPATYREAAAKDAWERVLRFYKRALLT